ncbi:hypothetical protein F442_09669 [Phytophthora nicotianae P10297]|uniref:Uncharacterized protein n=1 Tax=Phytophthora nicotianae P10297 TaxID=1317064 RepID=W2Z979_PHYNI|nr:hypothetical protein F442_09669 [Phytophthora nicotianae P10297]
MRTRHHFRSRSIFNDFYDFGLTVSRTIAGFENHASDEKKPLTEYRYSMQSTHSIIRGSVCEHHRVLTNLKFNQGPIEDQQRADTAKSEDPSGIGSESSRASRASPRFSTAALGSSPCSSRTGASFEAGAISIRAVQAALLSFQV